jgi:SAM-dependent methyltransferase
MVEPSGWQLSGSGPEAYEQYIVPAWMGEWAQDLVAVSHIQAGQRVLDVGCGTGVVTRAIARLMNPSGEVVGLDVNDAMLQMARQFADQEGLSVMTWQQGHAAAMPFPDASYDVVVCQQGLQYFPDHAAALREMARVLVPGGRLALSVWRALERHPFFVALVNALESHLGVGSTTSLRAAFTLTDREQLRSLAETSGFRHVKVRLDVKMSRYPSLEEFVPGYLMATPMASEVAAMTDIDRSHMVREVIGALQEYIDDSGLAAPMECHLVTAQT